MVNIAGTQEITHDGEEGTAFTIKTTALSKKAAEGRAFGAMVGRFPSKLKGIEALSITSSGSEIPGANAYKVEVFVPHDN